MPTDTPIEQTAVERVVTAELLQQRTPDGKIQIERWVAEDATGNLVNHGLYKEYDAKGAIVRTGNFRMGKLDGVWKQTIPVATAQRIADTIDSGFRPPFHSEANFVNGNLEGDWTLADSIGNAVAVWQFENNVRSGASVWLNSRGKSVREINYRNGVPDGPATRFLSTQKEPEKFMYYQGKVLKSRTVWFDPDRRTKKRLEESFLIADGEQFASHDWWNSQITTETFPTGEPLRHGKLVGWHANGTKSVEGQFVHNQPVGEFQWWYPSGQLQSKGVYADGDMTGTWAWWYPNGMKMLLGEYAQGEQMGVWSQWAADGKLVQRDEADKFPTVKQDILPTSETQEAVAETPRAISRQQQSRRVPTTNRFSR
jgi:antitoxin component YwqK of YwqJK toxin-antitoxin module